MAIDQRNDQRNISSTLRMMSTDALRKYGELHKSDPFIFPLVFQESQDRQHARNAQQMQGGQAQPKVVDQALAQMAPQPAPQQMAQAMPEDQGIAQIPAGNMNFAGGGIIAFADGGDVERFNGQSKSWVEDFLYSNVTPAERARREKLQAQADAARLPTPYEQERAANMATVTAGSTYTPEAYGVTTPAPLEQGARYPGATPAAAIEKGPAPADKAAATDKVVPAADTTRKALGAAAAGKNQPPQAGLDDLIQKYQRQTDLNIGAAKNATTQYAKSLEEEGTQFVESEKKRVADKVDPYKNRETRLLKQEKDSEGMSDKYMGLALLQAGAAMMTTPGGIGMALGKGVQVGSERYIAGIDKINAAKEKFALAKDRLEDLRLNRSDMDARDIRDAEKESRLLKRQGDSLFYSGAKDELNMKDKQITAVLGLAADDLKTTRSLAADRENTLIRESGSAGRTAAQIASSERIAAMPTGADRTAMILGEGSTDRARLESGLKKMQEITADKSGMAAVKLLTETNAKLESIGKQPITMQELLSGAQQFSALMYPKVGDVAPTRDRPR